MIVVCVVVYVVIVFVMIGLGSFWMFSYLNNKVLIEEMFMVVVNVWVIGEGFID